MENLGRSKALLLRRPFYALARHCAKYVVVNGAATYMAKIEVSLVMVVVLIKT